MYGVREKACATRSARHGTTPEVVLCGLFWTLCPRRVSAKGNLCLFICPATGAVHLEMAFSINTTDFLNE